MSQATALTPKTKYFKMRTLMLPPEFQCLVKIQQIKQVPAIEPEQLPESQLYLCKLLASKEKPLVCNTDSLTIIHHE